MSALVRAFQEEVASSAGEAARSTYDTEDLAGFLGALYARGREAHPKLAVSEDAFGRLLARCADARPLDSLDRRAIEDLYLACGCAEGVRGAAAAFERTYGKAIERAVSRVLATDDDRKDAEQRVRQLLLVGTPEAGPTIARYRADAPLAKWVPVVAIRIAMRFNRSESSERRLRTKAGAEAIGVSPEHLYMRAEIRSTLEPAVSEALGRLGDRDRFILRMFLVGGMTLHAIGVSLGLSQQAVSKRLAKARQALLEDIRATVASRLNIPEDEFSSLIRVVASQLDVNISRVLRRK